MKTFRQYLAESAQEKMHTNPSAEQIHNITASSKFKEGRFTIDKDNNMHFGDSHHFVHAMLGHGAQADIVQNTKIVGYVRHHEGKSIVQAWHKGTDLKKVATHPRIEKILKRKNFVSGHE